MAPERQCLMTNSPLTANQLEKNAPGAYCSLPTSLQQANSGPPSTRPSTRVKPSLASNHFRLSAHSSNLTSARIDLPFAPVPSQQSPPHPPLPLPFNHIAKALSPPQKFSDRFHETSRIPPGTPTSNPKPTFFNIATPEAAPGAEHLNIKVSDNNNEIFFKIKRTTKLEKLMTAFCERQGKSISSVRFLFEGTRVQPSDTPEALEMADGDQLDVHQEQVGGW
uniref:Ubiquitin-like domain-containing protein n=1 Tax=Bionectria ochroleuca TaxID=29856 RepID=A0A8H7TQQ3_BIOOC